MQGTPWGLLELESNGSNVFQEVFHVDQVVPSLPHSCVHVYSHVILQIDGCEQLATESTILQNSLNLFLLG